MLMLRTDDNINIPMCCLSEMPFLLEIVIHRVDKQFWFNNFSLHF